MWHTRDGSWFGCVWFGAFFFFFFNSFPFLVRGCASEKYAQLAYIIGKLSWVALAICHKPEPSRYQLQEKAGRSISATDSIFWILFRLCQSVPDVMCWFFRCELPVCWEPRRPLGVGHPPLTDGSDLGRWGCWLDPTQLRRERNHNTS